jgi:hypothetical protein
MRSIPSAVSALSCCVLVACAAAPEPQPVAAPAPSAAPSTSLPLAQLEEIFWSCDYVATTRGVDATPAAQCAAATRELRRVKFANSFQAMLAWWRENKPVEHDRQRRARSEQPL